MQIRRVVLVILLCGGIHGPAHSQISPEAQAYLMAALDSMQQHSVRRDFIDWTALRQRALEQADHAQAPDDTYNAIDQALRQLGDGHSFLMRPEQTTQFSRKGVAENPAPVVRRVDRIGYVMLPGYTGGKPTDLKHYAQHLQRSIARADTPLVCGWIVDLRENSGGNMWPMLAGIGPILGEGIAGMFVDPRGHRTEWSYRGGTAWVGTVPQVSADDSTYVSSHRDRPVAVLTGPKTASSGEAIVISFRERPNTRTFGQSTRGLSTSNRGVRLSDGAWLMLTTSVFADRTGKRYGSAIDPDEQVSPSAVIGSAEEDSVFAAASEWLARQSACSR